MVIHHLRIRYLELVAIKVLLDFETTVVHQATPVGSSGKSNGGQILESLVTTSRPNTVVGAICDWNAEWPGLVIGIISRDNVKDPIIPYRVIPVENHQ